MSDEKQYPCAKCGKLRTKAEGGTVFTVCDACWDGEPMVGDYESDLAAVTAERDRLKRLVESLIYADVTNGYSFGRHEYRWRIYNEMGDYDCTSTHDTVLEAFEAIPSSTAS